jgi:hypothetical protein
LWPKDKRPIRGAQDRKKKMDYAASTNFLSLFRTASGPAFVSASRHDSGTLTAYSTVGSSFDRGARWPLSLSVMIWGVALLIGRLDFKGFYSFIYGAFSHAVGLASLGKHLVDSAFFARIYIQAKDMAGFCVFYGVGFLFHFVLLGFGLFLSLFLLINIINSKTIVNGYFKIFSELCPRGQVKNINAAKVAERQEKC